MNVCIISLSGCICNIFKTKDINFEGFEKPPYDPETYFICIALSTIDSAVIANNYSFQY